MRKPIVAVVGKPNVGKSTFFNKISGKKISIVKDEPGVTRDRIYVDVEWTGYNFTMIDTGGIEPNSEDVILSQMREQATMAIESADVILFMIDGRETYTSSDEEIAQMLRRSGRPILLVANKIDTHNMPEHFYDYYDLGVGEPFPISSVNKLNFGDLLDKVVEMFPKELLTDDESDEVKVALIGRPNAGKSSLINNILGENRVIVSDVAGTTRDAIDTLFSYDDKDYVLIDTAGIRRRKKVSGDVEKYSVMRAITAIERCDIALIVIDANEGVTDQDKRIAGYAHEAGCGCIILINKWDLVQKDNKTLKQFTQKVRNELAFMTYAPILFVSALTGQRVHKILEEVDLVSEHQNLRVQTGLLNDIINEAILLNQAPSDKGKRLKIYYMTQVSVKPPTFVLFVNDKELAHFSYLRYLENVLRKQFQFYGTPIMMEVRQKKKIDAPKR